MTKNTALLGIGIALFLVVAGILVWDNYFGAVYVDSCVNMNTYCKTQGSGVKVCCKNNGVFALATCQSPYSPKITNCPSGTTSCGEGVCGATGCTKCTNITGTRSCFYSSQYGWGVHECVYDTTISMKCWRLKTACNQCIGSCNIVTPTKTTTTTVVGKTTTTTISSQCKDSDGGQNWNVQGTTTKGTTTRTDTCSLYGSIAGEYPYLQEYYCDSSGNIAYVKHTCTCSSGVCIGGSSTTTTTIQNAQCSDSDGGNKPDLNGRVMYNGVEIADYCATEGGIFGIGGTTYIYEAACINNIPNFYKWRCDSACYQTSIGDRCERPYYIGLPPQPVYVQPIQTTTTISNTIPTNWDTTTTTTINQCSSTWIAACAAQGLCCNYIQNFGALCQSCSSSTTTTTYFEPTTTFNPPTTTIQQECVYASDCTQVSGCNVDCLINNKCAYTCFTPTTTTPSGTTTTTTVETYCVSDSDCKNGEICGTDKQCKKKDVKVCAANEFALGDTCVKWEWVIFGGMIGMVGLIAFVLVLVIVMKKKK